MNITKCSKGHIFDKDKFDDCPVCAMVEAGISEKSIIKAGNDEDTLVSEGSFYENLTSKKTVGWLTSLTGGTSGQSINLYEGRNTIKKLNYNADENAKIATSKNIITITYTQKKGFVLNPNRATIFINGKQISKSTILTDRCIITTESNQYMFVALCNNDFKW
ncbi:MAG: hypothetical protein K6G11_09565 [Lachnospiraceae bacterium]|nr:hypothetical protein [Lachnospiraceae bacterium]